MRKVRILGWGALALTAAALIFFFGFLPAIFDRAANRVTRAEPWPLTPAARALHQRLVIVDLHIDTLLWKRDVWRLAERGHVDLPRMEAGNLAIGVFSSVTKVPRGQNYERNPSDSDVIWLLSIGQLQPWRTWFSLIDRSLWHAEKLKRAQAAAPNLRIIRSVRDLDEMLAARRAGRPRTGVLLSIEGLQNLEGDFANLAVLRAAGFRMAGLAHFFDNEVAGSVHGEAKGGLTPLGRRVVTAMEASGMIVDLAHASHRTIAEVLAMATRPVVLSHGGVKGTCNTNRTLSDAEVRGIARTGGVVGIGLWDAAVCAETPAATAKAMAYVRDLVGIGAVALGSDFDGAVATPFDAAGLVALTQALLDEGFTPAEIEAAMGGNALRVFRATLPAV